MKKILIAIAMIAVTGIVAKEMKTGLDGYCPVAYVEMGKAVKGSSEFKSDAGGMTYLFVNADAKKMFDTNPKKYTQAVQYGAYCATGMSMGKKIPSDFSVFTKQGDKVYFFSSADAKAMFDKDAAAFTSKADKAWAKMKK